MSTILRMNCKERNAKSFKYCPRCASGNFGFRSEKLLKCDDCAFEFYFNTTSSTAAIIVDQEGRLLVTIRGEEPAKGTWDLPGGFVDPGESAEDGLRREIREELGLEVVSAEYLCSAPNTYEYKGICYRTVDLAYVCRVEDASKAKAQDDVVAFHWKRPDEIDAAQFGFASIEHIVTQYLGRQGKGE